MKDNFRYVKKEDRKSDDLGKNLLFIYVELRLHT